MRPLCASWLLPIVGPLVLVLTAACSDSVGHAEDDSPSRRRLDGGPGLPESTFDGGGVETSNVPPAPPSTPEQACAAFADALCKASAQKCSAAVSTLMTESPSVCLARYTRSCLLQLTAPDVNMTVASVGACTASLSTLSCEQLFFDLPATCIGNGKRADGASCVTSSQCQSSSCIFESDDDTCGTCKPRAKQGETCGPTTWCEDGLQCNWVANAASGTGKCFPLAANTGAPCSHEWDCPAWESCVGRITTQSSPYVSSGTCEPWSVSPPGGTCGWNTRDKGNVVVGYTACVVGFCIRDDSNVGRCSLLADEGQKCPDGKMCRSPARCVAGTCVTPDPSRCK